MFADLRQKVQNLWSSLASGWDPSREFARIDDAIEAGEYDRALRDTERILRRSRSLSAMLHSNLSKSMMFNSAEEYNNFLRRNPSQTFVRWVFPSVAEAHFCRARVFQRSGRLRSSRLEIEDSLREFPRSAKYHLELGMLLAQMGYRPEAARHLGAACAYDLTDSQTYRYPALLAQADLALEECRFREARYAAIEAAGIIPDSSEPGFKLRVIAEIESDVRQRAEFLLATGNFELAEKACQEALEVNPNDYDILLGSAFACKELDRLDDAETCLRRAFQCNPGSSQVCFALGWVYLIQGRLADSEKEFLQALRKNPHDAAYLVGAAYCYLEQIKERHSSALEHKVTAILDKASSIDPNYVEPHIVRAELHLAAGRHDLAKKAIGRALALNPASQPAHIVAAEIYLEAGEKDKSAYHLDEASEYGRDTEEMRQLGEELKGDDL